MTHTLKTWPEYFHAVITGHKTFEIRKNDRNFKQGDTLLFKEWNPDTEKYTNRQHTMEVCYVLEGGQFGLEEGHVAMGLVDPEE